MIDITAIKKTMKNSFEDDRMAEDQFEGIKENLEKLGYEVSYSIVNDGEWVKSGDENELRDFLAVLNIDGEKLYVEIEQRCSGGVEPYYYDPDIASVMTEKEYEVKNLICLAKFNFRESEVSIFSNGMAYIGSLSFSAAEEAIEYLIKKTI